MKRNRLRPPKSQKQPLAAEARPPVRDEAGEDDLEDDSPPTVWVRDNVRGEEWPGDDVDDDDIETEIVERPLDPRPGKQRPPWE